MSVIGLDLGGTKIAAALFPAHGEPTHREAVALEGVESTINLHIRNLRAKIEPDPKHPSYIETVFGVGYRLCSE